MAKKPTKKLKSTKPGSKPKSFWVATAYGNFELTARNEFEAAEKRQILQECLESISQQIYATLDSLGVTYSSHLSGHQ